jgi:hypothetical protein
MTGGMLVHFSRFHSGLIAAEAARAGIAGGSRRPQVSRMSVAIHAGS